MVNKKLTLEERAARAKKAVIDVRATLQPSGLVIQTADLRKMAFQLLNAANDLIKAGQPEVALPSAFDLMLEALEVAIENGYYSGADTLIEMIEKEQVDHPKLIELKALLAEKRTAAEPPAPVLAILDQYPVGVAQSGETLSLTVQAEPDATVQILCSEHRHLVTQTVAGQDGIATLSFELPTREDNGATYNWILTDGQSELTLSVYVMAVVEPETLPNEKTGTDDPGALPLGERPADELVPPPDLEAAVPAGDSPNMGTPPVTDDLLPFDRPTEEDTTPPDWVPLDGLPGTPLNAEEELPDEPPASADIRDEPQTEE